ncbi:hypothetical protein JCM14469_04650 [Desulfatiferula olefinivorans]
MRRFVLAGMVWLVVSLFALAAQAEDYIDLGIERTDVFTSGSGGSTDLTTIKPISLVCTVRNHSAIALDGFTLTPSIDTYYEGTLLGPATGAFYFQPNYINNAPYTSLSIDLNGTIQFRADITRPRAGHYRCVVRFTLGGAIAGQDADGANNQTVVEFDVREETPPSPDLAVVNVRLTRTTGRFQVAYDVKNVGTDPASSVFAMEARLFVGMGPTTIMVREDTIRAAGQPILPGESVSMGPVDVRDSRDPNAPLPDGSYRIAIFTTQGCSYDADIYNNSVETTYDLSGAGSPAETSIDLGIERTDVSASGSGGSTDLTTIKTIALVCTVRNYSTIAIDGFTLTPSIETYHEGTLLGPTTGAFYFQPNYINNAPNTSLSIDLNGTVQFRANITRPKAGHYRCVVRFTLGGAIAGQDADSANNQAVVEFDVREETPPAPDLAVDHVRIIKSGERFQVAYQVKNNGVDPAVSVFAMAAKIFVGKGPTTIMVREDTIRQASSPIAFGEVVSMGPFDVRDSRSPGAPLTDGIYKVAVFTTQGCNYDTNIYNNRVEMDYNFWPGGGDYAIDGVPASCRPGSTLSVSYRCAWLRSDLSLGLFKGGLVGSDSALNVKALSGPTGTLSFKVPDHPSRCLFAIVDGTGQPLASSTVVRVEWDMADSEASSAKIKPSRPWEKGPEIVRNEALNRTGMSRDADRSVSVPSAVNRAVSVGQARTIQGSKAASVKEPSKKAAMLKKRSAAIDTLDEDHETNDAPCDAQPVFSVLDGYDMEDCVTRHGEAVIRVDGSVDSDRNIRHHGKITLIRYSWPGEAGPSPGERQVRDMAKGEAKTIGATLLADRPGYTVFLWEDAGRTVYVVLETDPDGRSLRIMEVEPDGGP